MTHFPDQIIPASSLSYMPLWLRLDIQETKRLESLNKEVINSYEIEIGKLSDYITHINKKQDTLIDTINALQKSTKANLDTQKENMDLKNALYKIQREKTILEKEINDLKINHKSDLDTLKKEALLNYTNMMNEKEHEYTMTLQNNKQEYQKLTTQMAKANEKSETVENQCKARIRNITMECENKISKICKLQNMKSISTQNTEIFQKKLEHLTMEKDKEISELKMEINSLKSRVNVMSKTPFINPVRNTSKRTK
ncbi:coiled-coil domain-containing protein 152-like [Gordionus sp. m RMFG-2023]|uniref:coiled-coil domain-containing protein 152-like n=1 Tax=Gordionus sp. m RMFG-2023 TaxID=3053472 RepID=UPI0031FCF527